MSSATANGGGGGGGGGNSGRNASVYRLAPFSYIWVADSNTNVTRVEVGPRTFIRQDHEKVVYGPEKMITVPPRRYCIIENPVQRDASGAPVIGEEGAKLRHSEQEIRLAQDPFPLYPGEVLVGKVTPLTVVPANTALRLRAVLDFSDAAAEGGRRVAGDEWLFEGPRTYLPMVEVEVVETVRATVIRPNQALRLRARKDCLDHTGAKRVTGEEWIVKEVGAYLPGAYEEVLETIDAHVLTDKVALHMHALRTFTDDFGTERKNGEEWLITLKDTESHIPSVYEEVVGETEIVTLNNRQYAVILDPMGPDGKLQLGQKRLVRGDASFFLQPGERLERGIQNVYVLGENQGLVLRATESFLDTATGAAASDAAGKAAAASAKGEERCPGDRWMIRGPAEYVPPVQVEVVTTREAIPLDENEGVYIRDIKSGRVRSVCGETYMLTENEERWEKVLPPGVEALLSGNRDPVADRGERGGGGGGGGGDGSSAKGEGGAGGKPAGKRDKTRVVTFRVPHNAAVQIYDYKAKEARVVFGPELVMLGPDEQFTQLSLSGGKPKRPNQIKALVLLLGPDFLTDVFTVETADHARLQLQLSYNWHFQVNKKDPAEASKLFSVPDFVGDACKAIASRVRGAVASVQFDDFHKNSAKIIRSSVFGVDEHQKVRGSFQLLNLVITSIDIQSVEPVDQRTRDALQKSVQLAIEITTNSQEAAARHEAQRLEQEAKGRLERQKITDEAQAEGARKQLLELQAKSAAVESTGQARAEAESRAEAARIEGEAAVTQARLKADAAKIEAESELERLSAARDAESKFIADQNELEISKAREMAEIESRKFKDTIDAIGTDTIRAIATAGPELQVKLLQGLGIQSTLITDGTSPINLFNTAQGLIAQPGAGVGK